MKRRSFLAGIGATTAAAAIGMPSILRAQAPITLNGAVQFNDDHAFNRALLRFEELVARSTPEDLEQAIALYRGDLLDGFSLNEEPFEEWTRSERERLRAMAVAALERLVTHYVEIQDFGRCVPPARRAGAATRRRHEPRRPVLQRRGRHRLLEISRSHRRATGQVRGAGRRNRRHRGA